MKQALLRIAAGVLAVLTLAGLLSGCGGEKKTQEAEASSAAVERIAPETARVGVMEGSTNEVYAEEHYPGADRQSFKNYVDSCAALSAGKLDYAMMDYTNALRFTRSNPNLEIASEFLTDEKLCLGISKSNPKLHAEISGVMDRFLADGTIDAAISHWIKPDGSDYELVEVPKLSDAPKIKVAIVSSREPTSFVMNGEYVGLDIEVIDRIFYELGYQAEYLDMEWGSVIAAIGSGKVEMALGMYNTPERAEKLLFTAPYFSNPQILVARKAGAPQSGYTEISQLDGKLLATVTGSVLDQAVSPVLPNVTYSYFNSTTDCVTALKNGKVEGLAIDAPMARLSEAMNPDLVILPGSIVESGSGLALPKGSALTAEFNREIAKMRESGLLDELADNWTGADSSLKKLYVQESKGENGTLRVACTPTMEPMCYIENGVPIGYEVDVLLRIADALGKKVAFTQVDFSGLITMLESGKADVVMGCMTITDERKQLVDMTDSIMDSGVLMLVRKPVAVAEGEYTSLDQLTGKQFTCVTGSIFDQMVRSKIPDAKFAYVNSAIDEMASLRSGRSEAMPSDEPIAQLILAQNDDLALVPEVVVEDHYGMVLAKDSPLTAEFNREISVLKKDGVLDEMFDKWVNADSNTKLPVLDVPNPSGTIRVACSTALAPMCYAGSDGVPQGFEVEMAMRVAQALGKNTELISVDFSGLIPMVQSGKADVAVGCLSISDERKQTLDMTKSYRDGGIVLVVRKATGAATGNDGVWESLKQSFIRTFVTEDRWKLVLNGLLVTVLLSVCSGIFGSVLGFGICMLRRNRRRIASVPAAILIRVVQGTPIVVLLMILYYVIFGKTDTSAVLVAILGFSVNFGVYVSEMMRTGIDAVDKGQIEAAYALGFNKLKTFWKITFPQAARHFLPVFKGEFISMVKMTSVVGYIAIQDLTKVSDIVRSRTLEAFFPLIATAVLYFIVANLLTILLTRVEIKLDPKRRKRAVKGVVTK